MPRSPTAARRRAPQHGTPVALTRVVRAELGKTVRRPAVWVLVGVPALLTLVLGYGFAYVAYRRALGSPFVPEVPLDLQLAALLPGGVPHRVTADAAAMHRYLAAVLGALLGGSEYGWRTVRTLSLQGPGRLALGSGSLVVALLVTLGVALAVTLTSLLSAAGAGALHGEPGLTGGLVGAELLRALGATWLMLGTGCLLGLVLAVVTRNASLGTGSALLWLVGVEGLVSIAARESAAMARLRAWLPGPSADAVAAAFPGAAPEVGGAAALPLAEPGRAALTLAAYVAACCAVAVALPLRRDVTE